jgi:hypothetical protein
MLLQQDPETVLITVPDPEHQLGIQIESRCRSPYRVNPLNHE